MEVAILMCGEIGLIDVPANQWLATDKQFNACLMQFFIQRQIRITHVVLFMITFFIHNGVGCLIMNGHHYLDLVIFYTANTMQIDKPGNIVQIII